MIAALDAQYDEKNSRAVAAAVVFANWDDATTTAEYTAFVDRIQPYTPGEFFRRELPCLLAVLNRIAESVTTVIIDGHVQLGAKPGLGQHLYDHLQGRLPVIGVTKTRFHQAPATELFRGSSKLPLYVTSVGIDPNAAASHIRRMHGPHRVPTLLKRVDLITRNGPMGFSLVELLVVIAIIAVLTAILLPVTARVRRAGRSTVCLAHLQQWGQSFQMYVNSNGGHSIPKGPPGYTTLQWWEILAPYNSDVRACLTCPEATEPRPGPPDSRNVNLTYKHGTAFHAWHIVTYQVGAPQWIVRGDYAGSYGANAWVLAYKSAPPGHVRLPAKGAERIPLFGDCCGVWTIAPDSGEATPEDLQGTALHLGPGVNNYCLERHGRAVNLVFLDGHAEQVPLEELWQLKWSETFKPHNVVLPKH